MIWDGKECYAIKVIKYERIIFNLETEYNINFKTNELIC